jgi:uncharacterized membrane protein YraQ (UPF0718 family)
MQRRIPVIDANLLVVLGMLAALAWLAWLRGGSELVWQGVAGGSELLVRYAALIAVSFLAAGLAEALVPTEWVREALGRDSGLRGILLASAAGILTPAGPFVSMPIAAAMLRSGAGAAPVVAFLTAWSVVALHRLVAWEVPVLGLRFALLRYAVSLARPVAAGLLTRAALR